METNNFKAIAYLKTGNNITFFGTMHDCAEFADKILASYKNDLTEVKIKNLDFKRETKPQQEVKEEAE